jgi:hypothetical protein
VNNVDIRTDRCIVCGGPTAITKVTCQDCGVSLEGAFKPSALDRLSRDDLRFVTEFVLAGGNLKALAARLGFSYPTVRSRLDKVIASLARAAGRDPDEARLLDMVAAGRMSASEAAKQITKMRGGKRS